MKAQNNPQESRTRRFLLTTLTGSALLLAAVPALAQYRFNPEHRRPVEVTIHDLEQVAANEARNKTERERYDSAIHHLHQFGERLHEGGVFDKDKLDEAIGNVQSVLDHNRLSPGGRDLLGRDVSDLRRLREHFDERYRYEH